VGFGAEILFIIMLGLLVLGPKQLHTLLGHVARAKAQFEEASRGPQSQLCCLPANPSISPAPGAD
jgi:Sec-independent protein translocase protein TatA